MNVGQLIAALWTIPSHIEVNVLFDKRLYDINRVTLESDRGEKHERSMVLLRTGENEEKVENNG